MKALIALLIVCAGPVLAETVVPVRTIRAKELITAADLRLHPAEVAGAFRAIDDVSGLEARAALYPNRPIRPGDVGPPAVVDRNQLVALVFTSGGLRIVTEGRALERAGVGDRIKVMNLASRATVTGRVEENGTISVSY